MRTAFPPLSLCSRKVRGALANLHPSFERARLVRGTLDTLGLHDTPVGIGTDGGDLSYADTFSESASSYMTPPHAQRTYEPIASRARQRRTTKRHARETAAL
jgi:hypothetical protein